MSDYNTIEDVMPDPDDPDWVAIIECQVCGERGTMHSTAEPRETQCWDCEACGTTAAVHEVVVASDRSIQLVGDTDD